jgi:hypothetical protein
MDFRERRRLIWETTRAMLEADNFKHRKYGEKRKRRWSLFAYLITVFYGLLKLTPLYAVGIRNAKTIVLNEIDLHYLMTPYLEQMGIRVLNNETVAINRRDDRIWLTGVDDPYYYFTDQAIVALEEAPAGFKIA